MEDEVAQLSPPQVVNLPDTKEDEPSRAAASTVDPRPSAPEEASQGEASEKREPSAETAATAGENEQIAFTSRNIELLNLRKKANKERAFVPPRSNCTEKIVLCLDVSSEMNTVPFKIGESTTYLPFRMIRRTVEIFLQTKHRMDKRHEFALVLLQESAVWVKDFVTDPRELLEALEDVTETTACESFDMGSLFEILSDKIAVPEVRNPEDSPPYVIRLILLYCRSHCIPDISNIKQDFDPLRMSEYFFCDIFYIHEPLSGENKCEEIFDVLCDLDQKGTSYIFEVARNPNRLHNSMAKLLAHPLQRPLQNDAQYKVLSPSHRPDSPTASITL